MNFKRRIRLFLFIGIITSGVVIGGQVLFGLGWLLFDVQITHTRVLCVGPDDERLDSLKDYLAQRHADAEIESLPAESENCSGPATRLVASFRSNPFTAIGTSDGLREIAQTKNLHIVYYESQSTPNHDTVPFLSGLFAALGALAFLAYQRNRGKLIRKPKVSMSTQRTALVGVLTGCLLTLVGFAAFAFLEISDGGVRRFAELDAATLKLFPVITAVLLVPLFEEVVFRAWLLEAWGRALGPAAALVLSALAFAVIHPAGWGITIFFIGTGLVLGVLWLQTRSLLACCTAHGTYNGLILYLANVS